MINGRVVIDAVGHCVDFAEDNRKPSVPQEQFDAFRHWLYGWGHEAMEKQEDGYMLSFDDWSNGWTNEELLRLFFVESGLDMISMHPVDFLAVFERGANPWSQSLEIMQMAPERVLLYAPCDPLAADPSAERERMARMIEESDGRVAGFKFYPVNGVVDERGRALAWSWRDDAALDYVEYIRSLGLTHVAIHKAVPLSPGSTAQDHPDDVGSAAVAFPDMTFEVVHSGWAFLDECALQLSLNENIYASLEATANTIVRMPRRFARTVGALVAWAPDRVLFGSGAPLQHPQPIVEAIDAFRMPEDLLQEGLPEFTEEIKAGLLGEMGSTSRSSDARPSTTASQRADGSTSSIPIRGGPSASAWPRAWPHDHCCAGRGPDRARPKRHQRGPRPVQPRPWRSCGPRRHGHGM
jgi:uncharacterized protein